MATRVRPGQTKWSMTRDGEGHRIYLVTFLIEADSSLDGPATVLQTSGLPTYGQTWAIDNDIDVWAWCKWDAKVTPVRTEEPNYYWTVEMTFSTKPPEKTCKNAQVEDPLLEPMKVSGSFIKYMEEATVDRYGRPILSSSLERMKGPQLEFDNTRMEVNIEQNVPVLQLDLLSRLDNTVNAYPLWGLPRRYIKLSNITWERKFYGQCHVYFTRRFSFEIRFDGFDRDLLDEGTKVLNGHWAEDSDRWVLDDIGPNPPNKHKPGHFIKATDRNGNYIHVILNGSGEPATLQVVADERYVAVQGSNLDHDLTDTAWWFLITNPVETITAWDPGTVYDIGIVVVFEDLYYIATAETQASQPSTLFGWRVLGPQLLDQGIYSALTTYELGDTVQVTDEQAAGQIHVEYYPESDFLLLGIPADLESV